MSSARKNLSNWGKILAKNVVVLLAVFFFSTFVTDNNIKLSTLSDGNRISQSMPVNPISQNLMNLIQEYDAQMETSVSDEMVPGCAIAIIYNGEIRLLKGYGVKKKGIPDPVDIHTAFRIGSVSKGFASVLTGIMAGENSLDLDDKIAPYMPDFHHYDTTNFNKITLRNILSHTSGFPIHTFSDLLDDNAPYHQIMEQLSSVPFSTMPGQVYSYQNVVYSFVDEILKTATGKDYAYLLREKIFFPLHMKDASSEYVSLIMSGNYASPHLMTRKSWSPIDNNTRYYATIPASGINASIADMAKWLLALTGTEPEVISPEVLDEVFQPVVDIPMRRCIRKTWGNAENPSYALGWRTIMEGNKKVVFHSGVVQGFRAEIGFCPEDKVGIVILFNGNSPAFNDYIPGFFSSLYQYQPWEPSYVQLQRI